MTAPSLRRVSPAARDGTDAFSAVVAESAERVIERAIVLADEPLVGSEHLMIDQRRSGSGAIRGAATFGEIRIPVDGKRLRDIEREALDLTMRLTDFNQSAAARILGISRPTLARKLRAYGLARDNGGR